jgi:hypothetical protein
MAIHRSQRSRKAYHADHDNDYRIRVREIEISALHLAQQKEYANGDENGGAHQAANRAAAAGTADAITHQFFTPENSPTQDLEQDASTSVHSADSGTSGLPR